MLNRITVQLPVEGLLFWKLTGREAMSESFALTLTVLGTDARIDRSKLLGQPVTVTIPTQNLLTSRYVNGKITRVAVSAVELTGTRYAVYQLTVEPDLWPMKRDRNLRIFQGQTVPQIVKTLLGEHQVNVEDKLTGSYRVWDYCVQYQESSLDFISRLMELEGLPITSATRRTSTPWCSPTPPRSISRSAAMRSFLTTRRRPAAVRMKRASASGRWRTA
jgi:type VI secretion system secreted protein VgrG